MMEYILDLIEEHKKERAKKLRKPINYRKITRMVFRLLLVGLIMASCTQSITWLGDVATNATPRYHPPKSYYYNYDY